METQQYPTSATRRKLKVSASGAYSVRVKDGDNCASSFSQDYNFIIPGTKALENSGFNLYPNPATGKVTL
ncbi:hypothetical protein [Adhaeribacter soli]|uniref:Uncharacterized protein n=1 Tax=Adhaeribacter soli TaxID=2607655 RepID=A0A5N1IJV5_9BACT|nr:hypothetical protein [Adhaeribacter soli]KAA9325698.1 hypothetical protein F0P94_17345 [Adhaeribacter soli]